MLALPKLRVSIAMLPCPEPVPEGLQEALGLLDQLRAKQLDVFEVRLPSSYVSQFQIGDGGSQDFTVGEIYDSV
jgi:hypothetical protein